MIALRRQDGTGIARNEIAVGKATGALGMNGQSMSPAEAAASGGKFVPGGVLVTDAEGNTIGAVGVSGDTTEKDEYCAIAGVKAVGLFPSPTGPAPGWRSSKLRTPARAAPPSVFLAGFGEDSEDDIDL